MPLDPQIAGILALMASMDAPALSSGTPEQARAGFRAGTVDLRDPATLADVGSVEDTTVAGAAGPIPARVYRPRDVTDSAPTVVFVHGGGYVIGDIDTHDDQARLVCRDVGAVVVSIDYRLAPEHPFPAGYDDSVAAFVDVTSRIADFGGDPSRVAVMGDSAGGNFSAGVAIVARDRGIPLAAQLLLYPSTDLRSDSDHASRLEFADGYFLTADDMVWFHDSYLADEADAQDVRATPLLATDLSGLAPAIVAVAEFDPLRDEGEAYAAALQDAGVDVRLHRVPGMIHGFFGLGVHSPAAAAAVTMLTGELRELLAGGDLSAAERAGARPAADTDGAS